jgi:hypothetical protein
MVVSTASRVLSPMEWKYFTCEQELLTVVYALQKFWIYVIGHCITVYSDNKDLSFLKQCNLASSHVTRCVMQLQEYDLKIVHIRVSTISLQILSCHANGLSQESRDLVMKTREIFLAKVDLGTNKTLMKELGNLFEHQLGNPVLVRIREELKRNPIKLQDKYMIRNKHSLLQKQQSPSVLESNAP